MDAPYDTLPAKGAQRSGHAPQVLVECQ